ncbi:MAG: hypothetical protein ACTSRI_21075 [Promethearchaeota archaeon]
MYPLIPEQNDYVEDLNIIYNGFLYYLETETKLSQKTIIDKMENLGSFLQFYHLGYSEYTIAELNGAKLSYYLGDFMPRKCLWLSKSSMKKMCQTLKNFVKFLKIKLDFFQNKDVYKDIIDSLDFKDYLEIFEEEQEDDGEISKGVKYWSQKISEIGLDKCLETINNEFKDLTEMFTKKEKIE